VQLGKFGAFPAKQLLGRHYDVTYEIYQSATAVVPEASSSASAAASFGQGKGKKKKATGGGGGKNGGKGNVMSNPGWKNALKPLKERALIDAVVGTFLFVLSAITNVLDDIKETNEFIDDTEINNSDLLSQDEIAALREQGVSAEELIQRQIERHDRFELKTEFSKEKWRQRKEKK
jgi:tRNA (adenine-N(1)-)-methyltransferase non-catalytic subunit